MQVTHEYAICDQFYAEMTDIYHKLDYKKQGSYIITEVFTKDTVVKYTGLSEEEPVTSSP